MPNQIEVPITANIAGLEAGMSEAATVVKAGTADIAQSLHNAVEGYRALDTEMSTSIFTVEEMAAAQALLTPVHEATTAATKDLAAATNELAVAQGRGAGAAGAAAAATAIAANGFRSNTRLMNEASTLMSDLLSGQWGRMRRTIAAMANATGLLQGLFTGVGAAVLGTAGAIAIFTIASLKAAEDEEKFNSAMRSSGDYLGVSASHFKSMAEAVVDGKISLNDARDAFEETAKSGRWTGDMMDTVARGAADMAAVTGESVQKMVSDFKRLSEDPVKAAVELNKQYHFLTAAVYDHIVALHKMGDEEQAGEVADEALAKAFAAREAEQEKNLNELIRKWHEYKNAIEMAMRALGGDETIGDGYLKFLGQRNTLESELGDLEKGRKNLYSWQDPSKYDELIAAKKREITANGTLLQQYRDQMGAEDEIAKKKAQKVADNDRVIEETADHNRLVDSLKAESRARQIISDEKARLEDIHKKDPNADAVKGLQFDAQGQIVATKQWTDEVAKLEKKYSDAGSSAAAAARAAKKAASESMVSLEEERAKMKANGDDLHTIDMQILTEAGRLYGEKSTKHKAANDQMLADDKEYHKEVVKEVTKEVAADIAERAGMYKVEHDQLIGDAVLRKQQAEDDYRQGRINALQKLMIILQANADMQRADDAYFGHLLILRGADVKNEQKVEDEKVKAHTAALRQMGKAEDDFATSVRTKYEQTGRSIADSMASSATSILFHQTTLKQALFSIAQQTFDHWLHMELQKLAKAQADRLADLASHAAIEGAKTTVTGTAEAARTGAVIAGSTVRTAAEVTAAATSNTLTAGAAIKNILTNAAETFTGVYKAIAAIPYIGPFLAPALAAAAFGTVIGMISKVASAEKGWARVPTDGMPTELHKDEMVLPAKLADAVRRMANTGNGGGENHHYHIYAMDSRSMMDALKRNPSALAGAAKHARRNGYSTAGV